MSDQHVKYQKLKKIFGLQLFANFHKVLLYAMGIGLVSFGLYYSYYNWLLIKFSPSSYDSYFLRSKIAKSYKKYKSLVRLTILKSRKVIDKSGITFCFSYLDKLKTKPSLLQNQQKANPFLPPFEEGQFIIELDLSFLLNDIFTKKQIVFYVK